MPVSTDTYNLVFFREDGSKYELRVTPEQHKSLSAVLQREDYERFTGPLNEIGNYIGITCHYKGGSSIYLGIEPDGYTHS